MRNSSDIPAALVEFLYVTNPTEEALLSRPEIIEIEAQALSDAIVTYFSSSAEGSGYVDDQFDDQDIGGGGKRSNCVEPDLN